jgi:predicted molibdopterin-dependent oxidoreductase YjgC
MRRLPETHFSEVPVTVDGRPFAARAGDSVAATLLAAGLKACRTTPVSGAARGPYCMMGVCFDCLVTIDGRPNQQGCLVPVSAGMRIEQQSGARIAVDAPQEGR